MSEYQYYEFRAIDRSLSESEMSALRALSTRATITPHQFVNVYNYGDFRGDPLELMRKYFDAFVYVANWGTYQLMLRLPRRLLSLKTVEQYCTSEFAAVHESGDDLILEFLYYDEAGDDVDKHLGWITDEEAEGWLPGLLPLRDELVGGDLRCLYLGWLLSAQCEMLDDDAVEPLVPPGLGSLTKAQQAFVEFFWLDEPLIEVAAERSAALDASGLSRDQLEGWIRRLPEAEKDSLLLRLAAGDDPHLRAELLQQVQRSLAGGAKQARMRSDGQRTVGQLLSAAEERAEVKRREEAGRREHRHG
jgi:hypothetical protein